MEKTLILRFLNENFTKTEALRRLRILRDFQNWRLFEKKGQAATEELVKEFVEAKLAHQSSKVYQSDRQFLDHLGVEFLNEFDANNLNQQLSELEAGLTKGRTVTLYLANELPIEEVDRLGQWFKKNIGPECLVDIQYRSELIGGTAIAYGGVIKDYSLKARVESQKKEILRTLLDFRK